MKHVMLLCENNAGELEKKGGEKCHVEDIIDQEEVQLSERMTLRCTDGFVCVWLTAVLILKNNHHLCSILTYSAEQIHC